LAADSLVGRHAEMAAIEAFLLDTVRQPGGLLFIGEPGIGKTALLRATVDRATELGLKMYVTRPTQMESNAPFAALTDLLADSASAIDLLPAPQRLALRAATLREAPGPLGIDRQTVSVAFRNLLLQSGTRSRFTLVIDDAQWLDPESEAVLRYAARRLDETPVRWILSSRRDVDELGLAESPAAERHGRLLLEPLSPGVLHGILRAKLRTNLPRHALTRIADAAGGNPLYALELARAALAQGELTPGRPLPMSSGPAQLLLDRVTALPPATRDALLLLAAMESPDIGTLRLAGGEGAVNALDEAESAALIVRDVGSVRFEHPLVAEAAYHAVSAPARRGAHRSLATVSRDVELRARHLGRAAAEPDAAIASEVAAAAEAAASRGASSTATELSELACRLTPPDDVGGVLERRLTLARRLLDAGDMGRAAAAARAVIQAGPPGVERARARVILARALRWSESWVAAQQEAAAAALEPGLDALTAVLIEDLQATLAETEAARLAHKDRAIRYLRRADEPHLLAELLLERAETAAWLGHGWDDAAISEAELIERSARPRRRAFDARTTRATVLQWADRLTEAREGYEALLGEATDRGDDASVMRLHMHFTRLELQAGRWDEARRHAIAYLEISQILDDKGEQALALARVGASDAMLGEEVKAREELEHAHELAESLRLDFAQAIAKAALGLLELSLGRGLAAASQLKEAHAHVAHRGIGDPAVFPFGDFAEALVEAGQLEEGQAAIKTLERDSERLGRRRGLAAAVRARALLAAARGDSGGAISAAQRSLELLEDTELLFDHARSLLVAGRVHRRARRKSRAHEFLARSAEAFDRLHAPIWAAQARAELARVGLRPSAPLELTDTEAEVARLAARGLTNREVAAAAFLTPRSVEGVLRRVYNKLGISSRAELGAAMAARRAGADR
jgi:DNA-binding CsgD family transcriptional regulator